MSGFRKISDGWQRLWQFLNQIPEKQALQAALIAWAAFGVIVFTIVAIDPKGRSATKEYQEASTKWWEGEKSLYRGSKFTKDWQVVPTKKMNGYLYLPQAAIFYTPYNLLPKRIGEPLWRMTCLGLLGWALWAAARRLSPDRAAMIFLVATVLVLPSSLASARNGQVNMPLAALFVLIAVAIARDRWHLAAIMLALTLALKPIAIAPMALCFVIYPKLRLPMILWTAVMLAVPFAHPNPHFAWLQYQAFWSNLTQAGNPEGQTWCDFAGMFQTFGLSLPQTAQKVIRALAGLATLILCLKVSRCHDRLRGALGVMLLGAVYLMLFNPRTETNSYVMLGIFVALLGAYEGIVRQKLGATALWVLFALALGTENYGHITFPWTNLWLKALVTSIFAVWLIRRIYRFPVGEPVAWVPEKAPAPR